LLNAYEAVLCAGDDETDENMFRIEAPEIISIKIGNEGETTAKFRVSGPKVFRAFLNQALEKF
jgi:trehalose-6-phosphatase